MLIHTTDGWRSITSRTAPPIREARTGHELAARMTDELTELCPGLGAIQASQIAAAMRRSFSAPLHLGFDL